MKKIIFYVLATIGAVFAAALIAATLGVGYLTVYYGMHPVHCISGQVST